MTGVLDRPRDFMTFMLFMWYIVQSQPTGMCVKERQGNKCVVCPDRSFLNTVWFSESVEVCAISLQEA